jgi:hypothetical protein
MGPTSITNEILSCFSTNHHHPPMAFLSLYRDTGGESDSVYPISLHLRIDDETTIDQIGEWWKEIKYWRDYIRRAQGAPMGGPRERFLFKLHSKNLAGHGYGSLAKALNEEVEVILRSEANKKNWLLQFEEDIREYITKNALPPTSFEKIFYEIRWKLIRLKLRQGEDVIPALYQKFRFKSLLDPGVKNQPFFSLRNEAESILKNLGFKKVIFNRYIEDAIQHLKKGQNIKKIVTAKRIRETLRWWRKQYGYPSPGKTTMG